MWSALMPLLHDAAACQLPNGLRLQGVWYGYKVRVRDVTSL
ncbi:hypothetical protein I553_6426 [Mycobacterium xenopi 4042]|uniref:Uncharacterized protein n=1 Tax=Mycobacterium xenopi 4042 TaxID=1299334 RepID=X8BGF1_MYCXE|nr:hypothetical protein I553_6426 [Mycobacterium xenopi 4042]